MKSLYEFLSTNIKIEKTDHLEKLYRYVVNAVSDSSVLAKYKEALSKMLDIENDNADANYLFELFVSLIESGKYNIRVAPNADDKDTIMFDYNKKENRVQICISKTKSYWIMIFMKDETYAAKKYEEGRIYDYWSQCWHISGDESMFFTREWLDYDDYSIKALDKILKNEMPF